MVNYEIAYKRCQEAFSLTLNELNEVQKTLEENIDKALAEKNLQGQIESLKEYSVGVGKMKILSEVNCFMEQEADQKGFRELSENEKKMISELYEVYESHWNKSDYEYCDKMLGVFCILNKYLTGQTGWRIEYEGSKAKDLFNPRLERT